MNVAIVSSNVNSEICANLLRISEHELNKVGITYKLVGVPGAFEIPAALSFLIESRAKYDGYVVLGCVIRSETPHFDYICSSVTQGITSIVIENKAALGLGIITADNYKQALERSDHQNDNNYAKKAVEACMKMIHLKNSLIAGDV